MASTTEVSIVVPLYNEAKNLEEFFFELDDVMTRYGKSYEIIFVNDGSIDNSQEILLDIAEKKNHVLVISLRRNVGKAGALEQGFKRIRGNKIVIIDCDLQYDPNDIETLLNKVNEGYDVVSGRRINREDTKGVKLTSWFFRLIVRRLSGLNFADYFSGLKCFSSDVVTNFGVYGDLNRIFAVYAYRAGFKVCEVPVTHRIRKHGKSRYNFFRRLLLSAHDLLVLFFTVIIKKEKLHIFGVLGFIFLSIGLLAFLAFYLFIPYETWKEFFENALIKIGAVCVYVDLQLRIIEVIGKEFLERHMGFDFLHKQVRMRNLQSITTVGEKELLKDKTNEGIVHD